VNGYPTSSAGAKVNAVIHELELEEQVEFITVDYPNLQHKEPWYLALNPNGKFPVLVEGDFCLWESNAIILYLNSKVPAPGLMPTEPRAMADAHRWLHWNSYTFYDAAFRVLWQTYYVQYFKHVPDKKLLEAGMEVVVRNLKVLEAGLKGREYLAGKLSLADFSVGTNLLAREIAGIDLKPFPNVQAWMERLEARPSIKKMWPPRL
jgi:glutathione S-transferase